MNNSLIMWLKWATENPGMAFYRDDLCEELGIGKIGWKAIYDKIYKDRIYAKSLFPTLNGDNNKDQVQSQVIQACIQNQIFPYEIINGRYIMPVYNDSIGKLIEGYIRRTRIIKTLSFQAAELHWSLTNGQSPISLIDKVNEIERLVKGINNEAT